MSSLKSNFDELVAKIKQGREFTQASFEPVYYLVFSPEDIVAVKRKKNAWLAQLKNEGWNVREFSAAEQIEKILNEVNPMVKKLWQKADEQNPLDFERVNQSLINQLKQGERFRDALEAFLIEAEQDKDALVLVTDLEALHPYFRIGTIEAGLQGKFNVPTVFLYPGTRTGKTKLKFLGFYNEDGNYRSEHVGG